MVLVTNFEIRRLNKNTYVVVAFGEMIADFSTFQQAQNFIFNEQARQLRGLSKPRVEKEILPKAA